MKTFKKTLLAVAATVALSPLAQAGVISFSDEHAQSTTDWMDTLTVSQFDESLGTLDSVVITFASDIFSDFTLDNDNATAVTAEGEVTVRTTGSFLGLGDFAHFFGHRRGFEVMAWTGEQNLAADDSGFLDSPLDGGADEYTAMGITGTNSISVTLDSSHADFLGFIGAGSVSTVGLGTNVGFGVFGGGGNVESKLVTQASALLTVEYNYTASAPGPVPVSEPGSLAILGLGLGLAGVALRRKKKAL